MKYFFFFIFVFALFSPLRFFLHAGEAQAGSLIKCEDYAAVYYLAEDGRRYVFPNEKIFFSWYENFDDLVEISCDELSDYALGDRIPYQAGTRLVKIPSVATVYVVEPEGALRSLTSEEQARTLYGEDWALRVDDLSEAFFPSYSVGEDLADEEIPYGTILEDEAGVYYRYETDTGAVDMTEVFEAGRSTALKSFALSFEDLEERMGTTIEQVKIVSDEELNTLLEGLDTVIVADETVATGQYAMSFHACDEEETDCDDPRNHEVYLAHSDDGSQWELVPEWEPFAGSVPDVIRRDDTLYVYTANQELVRYHVNSGWQEEPVSVDIEGLDGGFVDPSLLVNEEGLLVLFFLYGQEEGDPAWCPEGVTSCTKYIGSATEIEGSDGEVFRLDEGYRAEIELSQNGDTQTASDPDIFLGEDGYVLYITYGPSISVWTSVELQGEYEEVDLLSDQTGGIPSGFYDSGTNEYWTYAHVRDVDDDVALIRRAVHETFETLSENDWEEVISGSSIGLGDSYSVESPGFAVNE